MFRTALAAATLAAIAASASGAFAQSRDGIRNAPSISQELAGRITIRQDRTDRFANDVAPRIAISPEANNGPREDLSDRQIVVTPRDDDRPTANLVVEPGNGEQSNPPTQQIVINPGNGEQSTPPNQDVIVDAGRPNPPTQEIVVNPGQPSEPAQIVINPPADLPNGPVVTERPNLDQGQPAIDLVQGDHLEETAPAQPNAAATPETTTAELLKPWQIQFRLVREGFRNINFVEKSDSYFFLTAETENYPGLTYLMAVDLYGKVVSIRELAGYSAEARDRYQAPRYEAPRYQAPRYSQRRAPRYSAPRYSRIIADEHCDEYGRPRY